jgi:hypothetical protein
VEPDFSTMKERKFRQGDGNGDQAISLEEFQSAGKSLPFGRMGGVDKAKEALAAR